MDFVLFGMCFSVFGMLCASVRHGNHKQSILTIRIHTVIELHCFHSNKMLLESESCAFVFCVIKNNESCITQKTKAQDSDSSRSENSVAQVTVFILLLILDTIVPFSCRLSRLSHLGLKLSLNYFMSRFGYSQRDLID